MTASAAPLLLLLQAVQPMSCEQLRAEADRAQAQIDGTVAEVVESGLASMRGRRELRARQWAGELASNIPVVGGFIADAVTTAGEARQARLDARSDEASERLDEVAQDLGRRASDLETAYEMQCRRPAAAAARRGQP